jgi:hypothetical protein
MKVLDSEHLLLTDLSDPRISAFQVSDRKSLLYKTDKQRTNKKELCLNISLILFFTGEKVERISLFAPLDPPNESLPRINGGWEGQKCDIFCSYC